MLYVTGKRYTNMSSDKMSIFEILNLRSQWEEYVKDFQMEDHLKHGTIQNIKYFSEHCAPGNRFRKGFDEATDIADIILRNV